jgi:uncharacterized protein YyaL (SSP411 family)
VTARVRFVALVALSALVLTTACHRSHHAKSSARAAASSQAPSAHVAVAARSTDVIRRDGNHLTTSGSLYLQMHAHNPVDWYPWSKEALDRARTENKPIFLSIGYSSCHWCHVMEAEVFEHDDVAEFLNAHFISIKVDREERPDLDAVYMQALASMTGGGGWPMTLFLTPALKPFFGATYMPRDRFLSTLRRANQEFAGGRKTIDANADEVAARIGRDDRAANAPPIDANEIHRIATSVLERLDPQWGGFRGGTKFPTPVRWEFLLHVARKWGDAPLGNAVKATLDAMASGGIRDPIGGGFHRYSTDERWETPHFEKMLYDNAQLATLYLEAGAAFKDPRYTTVATDTLDFLLREMQAPGGGFYASFDADSGGREGAYYVWSRDELLAVGGPKDGPVLARILGVSGAGAFPGGASAPNRRASFADVASASGRSVIDVQAVWNAMRPKLADARAQRAKPRLDTKIVTAWNGLAIEALARGFEATGELRYRDAAIAAADFLWRVHRNALTGPESGLSRASNDGHAAAAGVLEDYAFLARGLLTLFEATNRPEFLARALTLVDEADHHFATPDQTGWHSNDEGSTPFPRSVALDDAVEPSGSAVLLSTRIALAALTLREDLTKVVDTTLRARASTLRASGVGSAGWLDAALLRAGPFYDLVIAGDDGPAVDRLEQVRTLLAPAWSISARVPANGPDAAFEQLVVAAHAKTATPGSAKAYVCLEGACKAPTTDPAALRALLLEGWSF